MHEMEAPATSERKIPPHKSEFKNISEVMMPLGK